MEAKKNTTDEASHFGVQSEWKIRKPKKIEIDKVFAKVLSTYTNGMLC